jgi:hypothetical protein
VSGIVDLGRTAYDRGGPGITDAGYNKSGSLLPLSVIGNRRRFVTAAQDRIVQIRRMGFSGVKRYDNSLTLCIYPDVAHSRDAHKRFSQFADAFVAILAFRRDCNPLQHRFVGALQIMRVGWIEMARIEWLDHPLIYASGRATPAPVLK